jgi:prepilin peptidase CpaA
MVVTYYNHTVLYLVLILLACIYFSFKDIKQRIICNRSLAFLLLMQCLFLSWQEIHPASCLLVLVIGLFLFGLRVIGAGDVKYAAVLALALTLNHLYLAVVLMGLVGGVLSVCYLLLNKCSPNRQGARAGVPYGVAISIGFYLAILAQHTPAV